MVSGLVDVHDPTRSIGSAGSAVDVYIPPYARVRAGTRLGTRVPRRARGDMSVPAPMVGGGHGGGYLFGLSGTSSSSSPASSACPWIMACGYPPADASAHSWSHPCLASSTCSRAAASRPAADRTW